MERMRTMLTDDGEVDVAESELGQFEEEARTAGINYRPAGRVRVGEETMTVADDERATFEEETAAAGVAWEPVHTVRAGGESVQVPQSLAGDFVREYREAPQFAEERKATALKVAEKIDAQRPWEDRLGPVAAGVMTFAKEQVNPLSETATPMANRLAGAANVGRAVARAPLTLAEKGMDAVGFAARGVEMLAGEHGKSGFREALETAKGGMAAWREKYMGDVGDTEDWGVTFGASAANAVAEAFMTAGLATGARVLSGAKPLAGAAENAGKLRAVWQAIKAPSAQSVLYGASQAEQTAAKGEKAGAEKWKQMLAGGVSGAAEMALESVSQVFGLQGQARDALKGSIERAVRQRIANVLGEGTTEGLQQLKTGAIEKLLKFDEKTWGQIGMETAQSAALGLVSAGAGEAGHATTLGMGGGRGSSEVREFESSRVGEMGRGPEGDGTLNAQRSTFNAQGEMGRGPENGGQKPEDRMENGGETLNAQRSTFNAQGEMGETRRELPPARADGAVAEGVEERKGKGGKPVTGVKLLMPDGKVTWSADPGEVAMAEYWLKDRMMFPPNPKGDAGRQAGDPAVNAGRRAGFDVTPGKSVLVIVGRSRKSYPAKVVEVLDDTHVRVRIAKTARALKNNREGYADLDVRQLMQYKSAEVKAGQEEELRKAGLNLAERAQARKDAAEFARLLEGGDEFLDQRALAAAEMLTGRAAGVAKSEELHKAYVRAAAALDAEGDLASPLERARALPKLRKYLGVRSEDLGVGREETPEEVWLARFRAEAEAERDALEGVAFELDSMTPAELEADRMRVESAQERVAQRKEIERRAAAGISGTAGDMTATLPGMEGSGDVPLFTEQVRGKREEVIGGELGNVAPGTGEAAAGNAGVRVVSGPVAGVYNNDLSAGVEGTGRASVAPAADGRGGIGMDLKDLVLYYRMMRNALPKIREKLRGDKVLGWFRPGHNDVELLAKIFGLVDQGDTDRIRMKLAERGMTPEEAEKQLPREIEALVAVRRTQPQKRPIKVLAHEISHMIDFMPDSMVRGRGNVLGHIAALKKYLKGAIAESPTGALPLTAEEKAALRKAAKGEIDAFIAEQMPAVRETVKEDAAVREMKVTAEDILSLMQERAGKDTPELYTWFAAQDSGVKREVLEKALKGLVSERLAAGQSAQAEAVATGRQLVSGIGGRVNERFRELLRKETEARRLIELETIKGEARASIPQWRGVAGPMEEYFNRPEEMYAEMYGMFLADPAWMETHNPTTFRALAGWMEARPEAKRAYAEWLKAKGSGQTDKLHAGNFQEGWSKDETQEINAMMEAARTPSRWANLQHIRHMLDRRMGPLDMMLAASRKLLTKQATTPQELARAAEQYDAGIALKKKYMKVSGLVRLLYQDVYHQITEPLTAAGFDWFDLSYYKALRRIAYELDGKAAPHGWAPDTAVKELERLRQEAGPEKWQTLERMSVQFRALVEQHVLQNAYVRGMLDEATLKLLDENVEYVTFEHIPTREQVAAFKADMKRVKGQTHLLGEDALDFLGRNLEANVGSAVGSKIYAFKGSFDPIADPLKATLQKMDAMLRAGYLNELRKTSHTYALEAGNGMVRPAVMERDARTGRMLPKMIKNDVWMTVAYMDGGEVKGFDAHRWLAEALTPGNTTDIVFLHGLMRLNRSITALYTTLNPFFGEFNRIRDMQRAVALVPGMKRARIVQYVPGGELLGALNRYVPERFTRALPKWLYGANTIDFYEAQARRAAIIQQKGSYAETLRRADEYAAAGDLRRAEHLRDDVALAREGLQSGGQMTHVESVKAMAGVTDFDRLLHKYGAKKVDVEQAKGVINTLTGYLKAAAETVQDWGEIRENTTKLATLKFLMDKPGISADRRTLIVSEWGGSPDFGERGAASGYMEAISEPFFNASKEGVRGQWNAAADHPADWVAKKAAYVAAPAALRWALYGGAGMAAFQALVPDPDEREKYKLWHFLRWTYGHGKNMSNYLMKNYVTHPLPFDTGNPKCSLILSTPMDQSDMAVSMLTFNALDGMASLMGIDTSREVDPIMQTAQSILKDYAPGTVGGAPLLSILNLTKGFLAGTNYHDDFRNKDVWTDNEMLARWKDPAAAKVLLGELWNRAGGSMFWRYSRDNPFGMKLPKINEILNAPAIQPSFGRFIRLAHSGEDQAQARLEGMEERLAAPAKVQARADFDRAVREGGNGFLHLSDDIFRNMTGNEWYNDEFTRLQDRYFREVDANPLIKGWMKSKSPEVQRKYEQLMKRISASEDKPVKR